jgi:glucosamine--fructose-6-phosphate aminotransferase (isomerizing)
VAATKTFVATLGVILRLVAAWGQVPALSQALDRLPDRLAHATELDWSAAVEAFASAHSLLTIGRGPTLAIAREAALKFKEICAIHAEAFSGAELMHGPISLISSRYPVLMFMPSDLAAAGLEELAKDLRHKGAALYKSSFGKAEAGCLPALPPDQSDADAVCLIQSFYSFAILLARKRGIDANQPRHLRKVTRTR